MFHNQFNKLDRKVRERVTKVAAVAAQYGDSGIVEWANRAVADAVTLGRIRDKDIETLRRLEDTYGHDYYNGSDHRNSAYA